jgi:hypothetical protein
LTVVQALEGDEEAEIVACCCACAMSCLTTSGQALDATADAAA